MLRIVPDEAGCEELALTLDEICLGGARRMLVAALLAEVDSYVAAASGERDECGHALVSRNGKARARQVGTAAGASETSAPRVHDRRVAEATGERLHFCQLDPSALPAAFPEGERGAAASVPARAVQPGLRAGPGRVLRHRGGAVGRGDH